MCRWVHGTHPICGHSLDAIGIEDCPNWPKCKAGVKGTPDVPDGPGPCESARDDVCLFSGCLYRNKGPTWRCCRCGSHTAKQIACRGCRHELCNDCGRAPAPAGSAS